MNHFKKHEADVEIFCDFSRGKVRSACVFFLAKNKKKNTGQKVGQALQLKYIHISLRVYCIVYTKNNKPQVIQTKTKLKSKIFISWQTKKLSENLLKNHVKIIFKAKRNQEKQKGNYFVHKEIK